MTKKQLALKSLLTLLLCSGSFLLCAQQTRVDSIIYMIDQSRTDKEIDTVRLLTALGLVEKTTLNDTAINLLERMGGKFINGAGGYWMSYRIKYSILNSLIATDKPKSLVYGKYQLEELEKTKFPNAAYISSAFFKILRLPYRNSNMLSEGFAYYNEKLIEYKASYDSAGLADCYYVLGGFYRNIGLLDQAIYNMKKSVSYMPINEKREPGIFPFADPIGRRNRFNNIAIVGFYQMQKGNYDQALRYSRIKFEEDIRAGLKGIQNTPVIIAQIKLLSGQLDSVMYFLNMALNHPDRDRSPDFIAHALEIKSLYKITTEELTEAETLLNQCWKLVIENRIQADARPGTINPDYYLALLRIKQNRLDEAIALLNKDIGWLMNQRLPILRDYKLLAELYEKTGRHEKANEAYKGFIALEESLKSDQSKYSSLSFETEQEMNQKELSIAKLESENKISYLSRNFSIGMAALLLILAGSIYYRFRSKKKANQVLEKALTELKSTQSQLIQSEKMASLGELTAGIAHEIQNPLNFVNNFSEVNKELLTEMNDAISKGDIHEAQSLAKSVIDNQEKINHHGKRADAIVKGMLQHSSSGSGKKEPTNVNALADEYLRLAYHGLRAKDKSFNATMKTDFDESIGNINIIPQDIGRVILNLITNAFYVVNERLRQAQPDSSFEPTVSVSTKKESNKVLISVKDNGNGIPQKILDKIFQPFFTTKPTGQGTGLGLSLSYDIVKAHGGEIKVETREGEETTFTIQLPIN